MAANNDIPPVPLPPSAAGVPPVEPAPTTPPPAPVPPAPPVSPAAPVAPEPLDALNQRPNPYAAPTAQPAYSAQGAAPAAYGATPTYAAAPPQGLALGGMITGIAAVFLSFFSVGFLPAVAAIVLGHLAQRRQPYARRFWITALITGYIALGISLIWGLGFLLIVIAGAMSANL